MNMRYRRIFGALIAAALLAGSGVVAGSSARTTMPTSAVRAALAETMELDGWPAALVAVRDEGDRVKTLAAGPLADPPIDYTVFDPSWAHAAGAMISTTEDMTMFFSALAEGELLPASLLAEMQQTIPADSIWPGAAYGLGLIAFELSCGVTAWGHGGDAPGTVSRVAATEDGRAAAIVVTKNGREAAAEKRLRDLVDTAICAL